MWKYSVIVLALALGHVGGSQAAGLYGNYPDVITGGPGYTTVYVDEYGRIMGIEAMGPVTPRIGEYGEPFRLDSLPHGAMSFGSIRVVPYPSSSPAGVYGSDQERGY